ncbi:helix-turn-helix transcriptional regulator [Rhodococcus sp. D2-41]|uniref:Helix-turn-helix domain-containing protein n=1 Tax=Speluncibacter jeojiensis TaxID=2710754 RepID=A0A9X4M351_9ACTN|nr:helix-turn-helix transcriptional regulator [Rhodococcus sp. D2-41]MDG3011187.1 helix-turn-helix transcriptional regulator [Rhodococcus sp. D2-41]MDG3015962.1 helix-turn-helix domain-containing protein [Corynebacteriales bacterium D3-21]
MADDAKPPTLGELIRQQRELAAVPMRTFAEMVGISNPYLSQIERNLRAPSEQVLEAIAEHLHTSADILTAKAHRADAEEVAEVVAAIRRDGDLTKAQRASLEEMYDTFRQVTLEKRRRGRGSDRAGDGAGEGMAAAGD